MTKKEIISEIEELLIGTVSVYLSTPAMKRMRKAVLLLVLEKLQLLLIAQERYIKLVEEHKLLADDLLRIALDGSSDPQEAEVVSWRKLVQEYAWEIEDL